MAENSVKKDCRLCACWFLGCLNGREKWEDKAITPNMVVVGQSGKVYPDKNYPTTETEYPLTAMFCNAFIADPRPERRGRVVG
ncbi:MAG: hypothetical protein ABFS18_01980 [Thermodesulfobacteriota bacterium]